MKKDTPSAVSKIDVIKKVYGFSDHPGQHFGPGLPKMLEAMEEYARSYAPVEEKTDKEILELMRVQAKLAPHGWPQRGQKEITSFIAGANFGFYELGKKFSTPSNGWVSVEKDGEPYFGWCDVDGCENEGASGGNSWRETGYWTTCYKHSAESREGKPQPKMKQPAIDREASRDANGYLPAPSP